MIVAAAVTLAFLIFWLGQSVAESKETIIKQTVEVEKDVTAEVKKAIAEKVKGLQDEVLADLAHCESGGIEEPDATIILDVNGRMSIGRFQWQRESVMHYFKKLYDEEISRVEAIKIAIDQERATELTRTVLFTEEGGWTNWRNCGNKLGIASRIDLINRIDS